LVWETWLAAAARVALTLQDAAPELVIRDGNAEGQLRARLPAQLAHPEQLQQTGTRRTDQGFRGCLGRPAVQHSRSLSEAWAYHLLLPNASEALASVQLWQVGLPKPWVDEQARKCGVIESIALLPRSLASSPEAGLVVWRQRTISYEGDGTALVYELLRWTPDSEELLDLYAEYRGPEGERSWSFDEEGKWRERLFIQRHPMAKKLGIEPGPCAAISEDGGEVLSVCGMALRPIAVGQRG
jgi:hypothetical protein